MATAVYILPDANAIIGRSMEHASQWSPHHGMWTEIKLMLMQWPAKIAAVVQSIEAWAGSWWVFDSSPS